MIWIWRIRKRCATNWNSSDLKCDWAGSENSAEWEGSLLERYCVSWMMMKETLSELRSFAVNKPGFPAGGQRQDG